MNGIGHTMTMAAERLLSALPPGGRRHACYPFTGPARTQWSYLPGSRGGIALSELGTAGRKAAHRLLATALSRAAFAQAVTIMAFEEVLDLDEHEQRGRHSSGYHAAIFGSPGDDAWAWRFEGHHISVNATIIAGEPVVAPLFLGANPAQVRHRGQVVIAPLLREEELARAIVTGLPPELQEQAVIAGTAPPDIVTATAAAADSPLRPPGITASRLPAQARGMLGELLGIYLDRLAPDLADAEQRGIAEREAAFAWAAGCAKATAAITAFRLPGC